MKKRMHKFLVVLCGAMIALMMVPSAVFAEEIVVEYGTCPVLRDGDTPKTNLVKPLGESSPERSSHFDWIRESDNYYMAPSDTFTAGETYLFKFEIKYDYSKVSLTPVTGTLKMSDGSVIESKRIEPTVNGKNVVLVFELNCPEKADILNFDDLIYPIDGAHPQSAKDLMSREGFEIDKVIWYEKEMTYSAIMDAEDTFKAGANYYLRVYAKDPVNGMVYMGDSVTAYANTDLEDVEAYDIRNYESMKYVTFKFTCKEAVDYVQIKNVVKPVAGNLPIVTGLETGLSYVKVRAVTWWNSTEKRNMNPGETFVEGNKYTVNVYLTVTDENHGLAACPRFSGDIDGADKTEALGVYNAPAERCLFSSFICDKAPVVSVVNPFTDVKETDWFYKDVMYAYAKGLMVGTSKTTFGPEDTTTRGMIVTILYRLEGSPEVDPGSFTDVDAAAWYGAPVAWAEDHNIVAGYGNGKFGPMDAITREQMVSILYRYANYKIMPGMEKAGDLSAFKDHAKISPYAEKAMSWAVGSGIISGMDKNTIAPQGNAKRNQVAAIFHRFLEK